MLRRGPTNITIPGEQPEELDSFRSALVNELAPQGALEGIFVEKIVAYAWRFRRIPHFEAALYRREEKQIRVRAARNEIRDCREFSLAQAIARIEGDVRPEAREAHQAAEARLKEMQAEPESPIAIVARVLETEWVTFSNLERYETEIFRSFTRGLHELQRFQAMRAGERISAPAVLDIDLDVKGTPASRLCAANGRSKPIGTTRN